MPHPAGDGREPDALPRGPPPERRATQVFISHERAELPSRELLRRKEWTPSDVLTGLDEGHPEQAHFHDVPPG